MCDHDRTIDDGDTDNGTPDLRRTLAADVARAGAAHALQGFQSSMTVETKESKTDLVTDVDRSTERTVVSRIEDKFPEDTIVGEEATNRKSIPESGYAWIIDPIDGTQNFVHGMNEWVTSVALVEDEEPIVGVNVAPVLDETYVGRGGVTSFNGEHVSVSRTSDPETFHVGCVLQVERDMSASTGALIENVVDSLGVFRRIGSTQLTLSMVARGALDGAVSLYSAPHPWDTLAGVHQVRAAGGTVTDLDGRRWTPGSRGIVASNGRNHDAITEVVERTRSD